MLAALGRERVDKLCIGRLVENSEGRLKVPPFLLLQCAKGGRSSVLAPGKPVACPEALLGSPNGSKESFFEELVLERLTPPRFDYKVDTNVDLQRGCREIL